MFRQETDITGREDNSIDNEKEELSILAENAPFGMALVDQTGRYRYVNRKFVTMFGYDLTDVPDGRTWCRKAYPDAEYRHNTVKTWLKDMETFEQDDSLREGRRWTFTVRCKDTTDRIINFIPVRLPSGRYMITYEDITELKTLETQLFQSQKMQSLGTLAGGIAHDFNNIITVLMGYAMLIKTRLEAGSALKVYVDQVLLAAERASGLSKSLLAFSRKQAIDPRPVDIRETILRLQKLLARLIGEDIDLQIVCPDVKLVVVADQTQIEQVLINLAANARDAMPAGGVISIKAGATIITEDLAQNKSIPAPGEYALISVSDTGTGIDETIKDQIFEPFFTTKETGRGTGLGLSVVYGIVKQNNGLIEVRTKPGEGTTFDIYFPIARSETAHGLVNPGEHPGCGNETIFLAEDDETVRNITRVLLEEGGYTVIEAVDGDDAVVKFRECSADIDLIILDVVMPRLNGREVYERIRENAGNVPVLFTSGYNTDIILQKGINSGKVHFMAKPILPDAFLGKVRAVLDRRD